MRIEEIGEFGLIERIRRLIKVDSSVIKGSGDDCAVLEFERLNYLLFTCDMLVEGVDFTYRDDPYLVGRKALAVSLSDIAACAGIPRWCLVALGLPKHYALKKADKICQGILDLARVYKTNIVGGDLSRARDLTIDVSVIGRVEKRFLVLRSGAKRGDLIFVSGKLGGSGLGRHLRFLPRIKEARFLVHNFKVNAMIDISDGLIQDLWHILKASGLGAVLYELLIPLSKDAHNLEDALFSGEDFELLFTLPVEQAKRLLRKNPFNFKPIGEIVNRKFGLRLIDKRNKEKIINAKGFQHF